MASTKLLTVPGQDLLLTGVYSSNYASTTCGRNITIPASSAITLRTAFQVSRMAVTNKGVSVKRVGLAYKFTSGTLASVAATLVKVSNTDAATTTSTSITLSAASPAFDLVSPGASQASRGMQAVAGASLSAANAGEANTASTSFVYTVVLTADSSASVVLEAIGAELEYIDNPTEPSVSTSKTANYTAVVADSGSEILVDLETTGSVVITLPAVADASDGCVFTIKCSVPHSGGTRTMTVDPNAANTIVGLGLTGMAAGEAILITNPNVGDYVTVLCINATTPKVTVLEARGAWVQETP